MTDSEKIEMLVDALTRIALIEIERGMYGPEAIERGMAAIGYAERALEKIRAASATAAAAAATTAR